jgi:hypothetical protein
MAYFRETIKLRGVMRVLFFLLILLVSIGSSAQRNRFQNKPDIPTEQQLKVGSHTVLIHSMDVENHDQKWTSLEHGINVTAEKKLITPYGRNIIRQNYLEGINTIIRVDQYLVNKQLRISAYVFDVSGNILHRKEIVDTAVAGRNMLLAPYTISQSPDKQTISLVQPMVAGGEQMAVSNINFDPELKITSNHSYTFPFDPKVMDMYMPLVTNEGYVFVCNVDKFDSYKLGSTLTCYILGGSNETITNVQFDFERRKIKGLSFRISGDTLNFSALFSEATNRKNIAGVLHGGLEISTQKKLPIRENFYSNDARKKVGKL